MSNEKCNRMCTWNGTKLNELEVQWVDLKMGLERLRTSPEKHVAELDE